MMDNYIIYLLLLQNYLKILMKPYLNLMLLLLYQYFIIKLFKVKIFIIMEEHIIKVVDIIKDIINLEDIIMVVDIIIEVDIIMDIS